MKTMGKLSGLEHKRLVYSIYHRQKICGNLRNLWITILYETTFPKFLSLIRLAAFQASGPAPVKLHLDRTAKRKTAE